MGVIMILSDEVIVAFIGVFSALGVMLIKDVIIRAAIEHRIGQRSLLQARLERAYVPLEYLAFMLLRTDDPGQKKQLTHDIGAILRQHGHLLSEQSLSAFYTLIEDTNAGVHLLQQSFYIECLSLKNSYYRLWYSRREKPPRELAIKAADHTRC